MHRCTSTATTERNMLQHEHIHVIVQCTCTLYLHTDHLTMQCGIYRHLTTHAHTQAIYCAHTYTHMILYHVTQLTRTSHSRIFQVHSVVDTPSSTQALSLVGLCTKAVDIVQPDGLIGATSSKVGIGKGN